MCSGAAVGTGTTFLTSHLMERTGGADGRNGTDSGKFETVAGFCGNVGFAAGQPGCMSISKYSPLYSPLTHILHLPFLLVICPRSLRVSNIPQFPRDRSYPQQDLHVPLRLDRNLDLILPGHSLRH
jgi:hypothetical protein